MKRPPAPDGAHDASSSAVADRRLKQAVREASRATHAADLDALTARVLEQWREMNTGEQTGACPADAIPAPAAGGVPVVVASRRRHRLWLGAAGLAAMAAVLATALVVNRPDPDVQELMQPDVLSQLAIGEM